VVWIRLVSRSV